MRRLAGTVDVAASRCGAITEMVAAEVRNVCDYCGCRSRSEIAELSVEHERVLSLVDALRHLDASAPASRSGGQLIDELASLLARHTAREETGVFAMLATFPEYAAYRQRFLDDHARIDTLADAASADRGVLADLLDLLESHVFAEETDLYPAIHQLFSPTDWDHVDDAVRHWPTTSPVAELWR